MGIPLQRSQPTYKMIWTIYLFKTQSNISQIKRSFRVLDQLVDVTDEGTAGHMTAGDLVDRHFLFCTGQGVQFGHQVCDSGLLEDNLDIVIESL